MATSSSRPARLPSISLVQITLVIYFLFSIALLATADFVIDDFSGTATNRQYELLPPSDDFGNFPPSGHGSFNPTLSGPNSYATLTFGVNGTFMQGVNITYPYTASQDFSGFYSLGVFIIGCSRLHGTGLTCAHLTVAMTDEDGHTGTMQTGFGDIDSNVVLQLPLLLTPYIDYTRIIQIDILFTAAENAPQQNLDQLVTLTLKGLTLGLPPTPQPNPSFPPFMKKRKALRYNNNMRKA